ncbi:MAG: NADP-dependent oxidoreductase [Chlamydiia bacterium]|nr:NADP-dependent oxidoreductase [Chlamydiia bacterium]
MKAIVIEDFGGVDKLHISDIPRPEPKKDEVLIEIAYAGVNPVDWKIREGYLKNWLPHSFPLTPGWDAAGRIVDKGKNVSDFKIGDEVWGYCRLPTVQHGTYAEYICVPASNIAPKPKSLSLAQAAAIPLVALTAWQAIFDFGQLRADQAILIHAGAGGVGSMAIELAKHVGALVLTTASKKNHQYVLDLGADHAIDYTQDNFVSSCRRILPTGLDMVLDCVGADTLKQSLQLVKPGGVLASIVDPLEREFGAAKNVKTGFVFVEPNGAQLRSIGDLFEKGEIRAPKVEELRLDEAATAQEKSRSGHTCGKLVLKVR